MTWTQKWQDKGGGRELLHLAWPLILSNSFLTLQLTIDRALLSQASSDAVAAAIPAALLYWTPFTLLQNVANYATTFVAQYTGAGRHKRVGPAIWQSLYFSLCAGAAFLVIMVPLATPLVRWGGHSESIQALEITYLRCLCFAALPALLVASLNSFFSGRGDSRAVLIIDGVGLGVNAFLCYGLVSGRLGFPVWGIAGAGWATVVGSCTSALVALGLFFRRRYRAQCHTLRGWKFEADLFRRLMRFGFPNGLQWMLDGLAFTFFLFLLGRLGAVQLAASNVAFSINMLVFLPMFGIGQAVLVLVGQYLGNDRPDLAERATWTGFWTAWTYMGTMGLLVASVPGPFLYFFRGDDGRGTEVMRLVPVLLRFVAVYSLFDSMNLVFSFALRGAGDTRFVTAVALALAWPVMVLPTWAAWYFGWGLYWAWAFASAYVISLGIAFLLRFRTGRWKVMRVIEKRPPLSEQMSAEPVGDVVR